MQADSLPKTRSSECNLTFDVDKKGGSVSSEEGAIIVPRRAAKLGIARGVV